VREWQIVRLLVEAVLQVVCSPLTAVESTLLHFLVKAVAVRAFDDATPVDIASRTASSCYPITALHAVGENIKKDTSWLRKVTSSHSLAAFAND